MTIIEHNGWLLSVPPYHARASYSERKRDRVAFLREAARKRFMFAAEQAQRMHMNAASRTRSLFPTMKATAKFYQREAAYWHAQTVKHRETWLSYGAAPENDFTVEALPNGDFQVHHATT